MRASLPRPSQIPKPIQSLPDSSHSYGKVYNTLMFFRSISPRRSLVSGLLLGALSLVLVTHAFAQDSDSSKRGRKYKPPPATSHVEITVLRATSGKPVENASVIFHPLEDGKDAGNMELKTNDEGKAMIDLLATGSTVRVQIIANGFQTYGEDYKIDKENMAFEVKLKRPASQYSIYKKGEAKPTTPQGDNAKPDATKPDAPKTESKPQDTTTPPQQ
jgi:hypothetical protein